MSNITIKDVTTWLKQHYKTVNIKETHYIIEDDTFSVVDNGICLVKPAYAETEYARGYSVSLEQLCDKLEDEFSEN